VYNQRGSSGPGRPHHGAGFLTKALGVPSLATPGVFSFMVELDRTCDIVAAFVALWHA
jgi:hypothetical protein